MNERIRELAEQAGFSAHRDGQLYTSKLEHLPITDTIEKFAELIVRECAQRCEDIAIKHQVEETTYAAGKKAGAFECAADLKQHFGVEE
jgi:hypothetical protein